MNQFYNVILDVAPYKASYQGITEEYARASVTIETDDEVLLSKLIAAILLVEQRER